ncbi:hypothetical protein BDZ89DRAFT_1117974 [Hymenopellis radicata]|nr:hypothetical protein BDZ89DRAFT_1117974 [Hymenopellis radicata]
MISYFLVGEVPASYHWYQGGRPVSWFNHFETPSMPMCRKTHGQDVVSYSTALHSYTLLSSRRPVHTSVHVPIPAPLHMTKEKRPGLNKRSSGSRSQAWDVPVPQKSSNYGRVFRVSEPLLLSVYTMLNDAATKSLGVWTDYTDDGLKAKNDLAQSSARMVESMRRMTLAAQTKSRPALYVKTPSTTQQGGHGTAHSIHPIGTFGHARELTGHLRDFSFPIVTHPSTQLPRPPEDKHLWVQTVPVWRLPSADATNAWIVGLPMFTQSGSAPSVPHMIDGKQVQVSSRMAGSIRQRSSRLLGLFSQLSRERGEVQFICAFEKELANGYELTLL